MFLLPPTLSSYHSLSHTQDFPKFHHLSTGDLLRQHVREQTQLGRQAAAYMQAGDLVPDALMIELLLQDAAPYLEEGKSLLLDGFPRNLQQAVALEDVAHIDYVVNLDIPTETIVARIADRWIHAASGRIYSYSYKPPQRHGVDDVTGEALVQREDDKPASVRTRLEAYDKVSRNECMDHHLVEVAQPLQCHCCSWYFAIVVLL